MPFVKVFLLAIVLTGAVQAQGKWGMIDASGAVRIPERYDEIGSFRGDLAKGMTLPEILPGQKGAKILKWMKTEGEKVKKGEVLAQVELREPAIPIAAPVSGMLTKIGVPPGGEAIPGASLGFVRVLGTVDLFAKKQHDVTWTNPGSATVIRWFKMEGDAVVKGEKIVEVRPMQAIEGILSPGTGTLVKIEVPEGGEAATGQVIARLGIGRVAVREGRDWFFVDEQGNRVTPARFDEVGVVQSGMAPVRTGDRWGFVDSEGNPIGKADYDETREVRGGLAAVRKKDQWGFVAYQDGVLKETIPPRFLRAKDFAEGLAAVEESDDAPMTEEVEPALFEEREIQKPTGPVLWGYIIPSGKLWIPLKFAEAGNFLDGRAAVRPEGGGAPTVLIDSRGKVRTTGLYQQLVLVGERRVAWKREAGWGLMDFQEKVVEIFPGEEAQDGLGGIGPFASGLAPAKDRGGKWGYLDAFGKWVVPPKFERAGVFRNGLATAKEVGGKWGFLRPDGSWGIEPKFSRVRNFSEGLAAVSTAGQPEAGPEPETGGPWE